MDRNPALQSLNGINQSNPSSATNIQGLNPNLNQSNTNFQAKNQNIGGISQSSLNTNQKKNNSNVSGLNQTAGNNTGQINSQKPVGINQIPKPSQVENTQPSLSTPVNKSGNETVELNQNNVNNQNSGAISNTINSTPANTQNSNIPDKSNQLFGSINTEVREIKTKDKHSRFALKVIMITLMFFILIFLGIGTVLGLAAYEKITIPNHTIQNSITYMVQSIPFMPKSPKYILMKSIMAHEDVSSANINASLNAESDEIAQMLDIESIVFNVEGPIDYNDKDNPKIDLNIKLGSDFDLDFRLKDKIAYYKINKLPEFVTAIMGFSLEFIDDDPITNRWVSYDLSEMETDEDSNDNDKVLTDESTPDSVIETKLANLLFDEIIPMIQKSDDKIDSFETYLLVLNIDESEWVNLEKQISSINGSPEISSAYSSNDALLVKNAKLSLWIDKNDYYIRKGTIEIDASSDYQTQLNVLGVQTQNVLGAKVDRTQLEISDPESDDFKLILDLNLSRIGENFVVEAPSNTVTSEQYMAEVQSFIASSQESYFNDYGPIGPFDPDEFDYDTYDDFYSDKDSSTENDEIENDDVLINNEVSTDSETSTDDELMDGINPL